MKKKLFLIFLMSILCVMMLTVVAFAKDVDIQIKDISGNSIVLPTVDAEGDALTWYRVTERPTEGTYFEYVDGTTTYYIVSVKTKVAAYVNDNYRVCYSYDGLKVGAWSGNVMVANLDGLAYEDGNGPQYLNFIFEGTPVCYVYFPASILELTGQNGNQMKSLFYGCSNLVEVEFEAGSRIETLHGNGFYNCKKLAYIKLPENLKTISAAAFVGINPTLVIPKSVTTYEVSNWSSPTVQFTGTASDHAGWAYQPSSIEYVNHCDAYYNGAHNGVDDGDCTTDLLCERCSKLLFEATADTHDTLTDVKYENGYTSEGYVKTHCVNCEYKEEKILQPIFTCLGYSAPEGEKLGIAVEYKVNKDAIKEYADATGKTFEYGVFAVSKTKLGENTIFDNEGNATSGVISTELSSYDFSSVLLKITGFEEKHKTMEFALGVYTTFDGNYGYIQENADVVNNAYVFTSYNAIIDGINKQKEVA